MRNLCDEKEEDDDGAVESVDMYLSPTSFTDPSPSFLSLFLLAQTLSSVHMGFQVCFQRYTYLASILRLTKWKQNLLL